VAAPAWRGAPAGGACLLLLAEFARPDAAAREGHHKLAAMLKKRMPSTLGLAAQLASKPKTWVHLVLGIALAVLSSRVIRRISWRQLTRFADAETRELVERAPIAPGVRTLASRPWVRDPGRQPN